MTVLETLRSVLIDLSLDKGNKEEFMKLTSEDWKEYVIKKIEKNEQKKIKK